VIPLAIGTLILNEQIYDNHGHGLTVNGIHVFITSQLSPLLGADVIVAHAHSEALCSDSSTTDTGTLPSIGPNPAVRPVVSKADSTKQANPGETVTYTLDIDPKACPITSVTDILPPFFHYVSSSGNLGTPQLLPRLTSGEEVLFWSNGGAPLAAAPHEVIVVTIDPNAPNRLYINHVFGTSDCGSFAGIDFGIQTTGPIENQGNHPGIIVPRPAPPAAPAAAAPTGGTQAAATLLPFTSTASPYGAIWLGVIFLGLALSGVAAARLLREGPID
jgi:hypothetical protein